MAAVALDAVALEGWWQQVSPLLPPVIQGMEYRESWTMDKPGTAVESALVQLAERLNQGPLPSADPQVLVQVLAYLRVGRALRLLAAFDAGEPGLSQRATAAALADPEPAGRVMIARLRVLSRAGVLARVFGPARRQEILELLEDA